MKSQLLDILRCFYGTHLAAPLSTQLLSGEARLNPLDRVTREANQLHLELHFPSAGYAREYAACLRYLPASLRLPVADVHSRNEALLRQFGLLGLPVGYL